MVQLKKADLKKLPKPLDMLSVFPSGFGARERDAEYISVHEVPNRNWFSKLHGSTEPESGEHSIQKHRQTALEGGARKTGTERLGNP